MAMAAQDMRWLTELERTNAMLSELTEEELRAIQSVAKAFIANPAVDRPYRPLTEAQLYARIDRALKQAEEGQLLDAADVEAELMAEFDLR